MATRLLTNASLFKLKDYVWSRHDQDLCSGSPSSITRWPGRCGQMPFTDKTFVSSLWGKSRHCWEAPGPRH